MPQERDALILALETIIDLERKQHEMMITQTALARVFRATSRLESDPLPDLMHVVREELARYAPDDSILLLTRTLQILKE